MVRQSYSLLTAGHQRQIGEQSVQANQEFDHARFKAQWNRLVSIATFRKNALLAPEDVFAGCRHAARTDVGVQTVPVGKIVGSTDRGQDFDRWFMPAQGHTRERWIRVNRAYLQGIALPPIDLWQVGDCYFVVDGHHRVSVARSHGQEYMDAHVIRIDVTCPVDGMR